MSVFASKAVPLFHIILNMTQKYLLNYDEKKAKKNPKTDHFPCGETSHLLYTCDECISSTHSCFNRG